MALSPHQAGGANDRREKRHGWIAGRSFPEGIALQTDLSRSLGDPPPDVIAANRARNSKSEKLRRREAGHRVHANRRNSRAVSESICAFCPAESSLIDSISLPGADSP